MERSTNLMDQVLGFDDESKPCSLPGDSVVLIEDCVQTSGAFVINHILKRTLSSPNSIVVFVALAHPFSHYDRVLRKLVIIHTISLSFFIYLLIETISVC